MACLYTKNSTDNISSRQSSSGDQDYNNFVVLTMDSSFSKSANEVHTRMPVLLNNQKLREKWLDPSIKFAQWMEFFQEFYNSDPDEQ